MNYGVGFWRKPWMPWICARRLFGPGAASEGSAASAGQHDQIRALSIARSVVGFNASALIYAHFGASDQQSSDWAYSVVFTIFISIGLSLCLTIFLAVRTKDNTRDALQPVFRA